MSIPAPGPEARIYAPSELNQEARIHLEAGFPRLWIRGEISNLARPASGHLYFSLKDAKAQIRCALFRSSGAAISSKLQNGDQVLVRGRLSLYEPRGDYQLIADGLLAAGAGELQAAFEALKKSLEAEGLFAPERRKPLPAWPRRLAVVTSPSGAAIRDILHVLAQRWPLLEVHIYPAQVQGSAAPAELIRALRAADREGQADLILLARGGGSIEDLWAFNDEALARVIAELKTPIISGVGHETDFTIADFVADLRAPTPSAAAVAATPDGPALRERLHRLTRQLERAGLSGLDRLAQHADQLERRLLAAHPGRRLAELSRRAEALTTRLQASMLRLLGERERRITGLEQRLQARHPRRQIDQMVQHHRVLHERLGRAIERRLQRDGERLAGLARALNAVSPLGVLERGYAVVRDAQGQALTQRDDFTKGKQINILLQGFEVGAEVTAAPRDARLP